MAIKKRRRRRRRDIENTDNVVSKQVISLTDLEDTLEEESPEYEISSDETLSVSSSGVKDVDASEKGFKEKLAQFSIDEDLLNLNEEDVVDIPIDAPFITGEYTEEKVKVKKEVPGNDQSLKLEEFLTAGEDEGLPDFAKLGTGEKPEEEPEAPEEPKEEEPVVEEETTMESTTDVFSIPETKFESLLDESGIQEDLFSKFDEVEEEIARAEEEIVEEVKETIQKIEAAEEIIKKKFEEKPVEEVISEPPEEKEETEPAQPEAAEEEKIEEPVEESVETPSDEAVAEEAVEDKVAEVEQPETVEETPEVEAREEEVEAVIEEEAPPVEEVIEEEAVEMVEEIQAQEEALEEPAIKKVEFQEEPMEEITFDKELLSGIEQKFASEIFKIKEYMDQVTNRIETLDEIRRKLGGSLPDLKEFIKEPPSLPLMEGEVVDFGEIPMIPTIEVEEIAVSEAAEAPERKADEKIEESFVKVSMEKDISAFGDLIRSIPALYFLKPRFARMIFREDFSYKDMAGLYRLASRYLKQELINAQRDVKLVQSQFEKYKNQGSQIEWLLSSEEKTPGPSPGVSAPKVDESELFVLNETIKKKEKLIGRQQLQLDKMHLDFANARARQQKDIEHRVAKFNEKIVGDLLKVADDFELSLNFADQGSHDEALIKGFNMTFAGLKSVLEKYGLEEIPAEGEKFDPNIHEALMHEETNRFADGMVMQVLRRGYKLNDNVLRPTQVKVSNNPSGEVIEEEEIGLDTGMSGPAPEKEGIDLDIGMADLSGRSSSIELGTGMANGSIGQGRYELDTGMSDLN